MLIKPIPRRTINRYMSVIISESRRTGQLVVQLDTPAFESLSHEPNFAYVMRVLYGLGYIQINTPDAKLLSCVCLTASGMAYFENDRLLRSEQLWTRGLAIASIIVSIASLVLAALSLAL